MFPLLYQAHYNHYTDDLPFWLELAARQKGPILELGCGTGRVLLFLARAGYLTYGLDKDARMLAVLQNQVDPELAERCHFFRADMSAFHLACQFPLILLPCNTLSTLNADVRRSMLANVHRHLSPGGLFATSLPNPNLLTHLPRRGVTEIEEIFPHPIDGEPVQVSSSWQRNPTHFTTSWHYDHLLPDGRVERVTAQACHEILPVESYVEEVGYTGLTVESLYGDFDHSPYTDQSTHLILLAKVHTEP